ncbi:hypothetical protein AUEXF2481DRAFT_42720 [Aureobasidium subglaciale EXF-2481]|uniref:Uncharacterized protein n=1 Tax=Aureobasidium subglaciale (strain EXF-2481) TaxID=1043005 RepID=A0A074YEX8_AURSE|nr:uncharacterized protein AUEXF2481DRAFT_42720 [Aureobasidium subglaciale EXF-2481]KEQ92622.1 hypothetical protein AUEXF2481DRAFT_42720 [Aureobasidium subglaciale EXF-2481]
MGWKQWALLRFCNKSFDDTLRLKFPNTSEHWGWPFEDTKDISTRNRIEYGTIEGKAIGPHEEFSYGQTGKQNEWAGMEGTVDVYVRTSTGDCGQKVAKIFYSCPWAGSNQFRITDVPADWHAQQWGADYNGDALGSICIEFKRI